MSDIKTEQLQKQNMMNKTVIAERQLFIANTPQADKLWWKSYYIEIQPPGNSNSLLPDLFLITFICQA